MPAHEALGDIAMARAAAVAGRVEEAPVVDIGDQPTATLWGSAATEGARRILFGVGVRVASGDSLAKLELACGAGGLQARGFAQRCLEWLPGSIGGAL